MRIIHVIAILLILLVANVSDAADRKWQTGRWTDVGLLRTPWVGDPVNDRMPPGFNRPKLTEVARYVIETDDRRIVLQDMVALGRDPFDLHVIIGRPVTFAIEKKTAYIKLDGNEYRLLVIKSERKKKP
jgi:hypothetical protein